MEFKITRDSTIKIGYIMLFLSFFAFGIASFSIFLRANILTERTKELEILKEQGYIKSQQNSELDTIDWIIEKIPDENPFYNFIVYIEDFSRSKDLNIRRISTQDEFDDEINAIPVSIVVRGIYPSLLTFIQAIEEYSSVVDINAMKLEACVRDLDSGHDNTNDQLWDLVMEVCIYYLST